MHFRWTPNSVVQLFGRHGESDIAGRQISPALDVVTRDGMVHVWVDLPGVKPEEITVYVEDKVLVIEGQKQPYYDSNEAKVFLLAERITARFRRRLRLYDPVVPDSFKHSLTDGVLHLCWKRGQ